MFNNSSNFDVLMQCNQFQLEIFTIDKNHIYFCIYINIYYTYYIIAIEYTHIYEKDSFDNNNNILLNIDAAFCYRFFLCFFLYCYLRFK